MPRTSLLCLCLSLTMLSMTATAEDSPRHALAACMNKRMSADRLVSYNEAQRMCKEQGKGSDAAPQTAANKQTKPVI